MAFFYQAAQKRTNRRVASAQLVVQDPTKVRRHAAIELTMKLRGFFLPLTLVFFFPFSSFFQKAQQKIKARALAKKAQKRRQELLKVGGAL